MNSASASCSSLACRVSVASPASIVVISNYTRPATPPSSGHSTARVHDTRRGPGALLEPQPVDGRAARPGQEEHDAAGEQEHIEPPVGEAGQSELHPEESDRELDGVEEAEPASEESDEQHEPA